MRPPYEIEGFMLWREFCLKHGKPSGKEYRRDLQTRLIREGNAIIKAGFLMVKSDIPFPKKLNRKPKIPLWKLAAQKESIGRPQ